MITAIVTTKTDDVYCHTLDNADEAEVSIENQWSKYYTNYTEDGNVYYRFKKAKLRGPQCLTNICLLYHADSGKVTIYQTETEHKHHNDKARGIDENVRNSLQIGTQKINKPLLKSIGLESDAAASIKNGFKHIFNNSYNEIMCWAHMKREIGNRICQLSTNNALEATNKTIKDDETFRERDILSRFLTISLNIINNWSIKRDSSSVNAKIFAAQTTISLELWSSLYQWGKSTKDIICIPNDFSKK
ncbi:unnamed protein product [Rotaria sp. Silwood2]|nr:unnamed protein product [Rotaria sp. Silwood2]